MRRGKRFLASQLRIRVGFAGPEVTMGLAADRVPEVEIAKGVRVTWF
ncbi:MAG: hypothetical protein ACE5M4_08000 [Anaerolineales bacterium]